MPRLRDLSIKAKLSLGFAASLVLIFVIGAIALVQLWGLNALATQVTKNWLPEMILLNEIKRDVEEHQLLAVRRPNITNFRQIAEDAAKMRAIEDNVDIVVVRFVAQADDQPEMDLIARFQIEWAAYLRSVETAGARLDAGDLDGAKEEFTKTSALYGSAAKTVDELIDRQTGEGATAAENVHAVYGLSLGLILAVLLFSLATVSMGIHWVSSNVTLPILRISEAMRRLTAGDNSVSVSEGADRRDKSAFWSALWPATATASTASGNWPKRPTSSGFVSTRPSPTCRRAC
jgi:hypothetical protein